MTEFIRHSTMPAVPSFLVKERTQTAGPLLWTPTSRITPVAESNGGPCRGHEAEQDTYGGERTAQPTAPSFRLRHPDEHKCK